MRSNPLPVMLAGTSPPTRRGPTRSRSSQVSYVVLEFLGKLRAFADPHARALIAGLAWSAIATAPSGSMRRPYAVAARSGRIIDVRRRRRASTDTVVTSGGAGQQDFVRQFLADAQASPRRNVG